MLLLSHPVDRPKKSTDLITGESSSLPLWALVSLPVIGVLCTLFRYAWLPGWHQQKILTLCLPPPLVSSSTAEVQCCFLCFSHLSCSCVSPPDVLGKSRRSGCRWQTPAVPHALCSFLGWLLYGPAVCPAACPGLPSINLCDPLSWIVCMQCRISKRCKMLKALVFETWLKDPHPSQGHLIWISWRRGFLLLIRSLWIYLQNDAFQVYVDLGTLG